jgi:uncharacterized protein YcfJ
MKTVLMSMALATALAAGPAMAESKLYTDENGQKIVCTEQTTTSGGGKDRHVLGTVAGGVVGGVVGNQIGGGSGNKIATAAGAVGGAVAGNKIAKEHAENKQDTPTTTTCQPVE